VQADAVDFSGGGNNLIVEAGYKFTGNVVSNSGTTNGGDLFTLGGSTNASFDLGALGVAGSGAAIQGFANFGKTGTANWTLVGNGNANQSWTISGGILVGSSTSLVGNITFAPVSGSSANVTFNQLANGVYNGLITGDGSLTKTGSGTLVLTADNTYTGTTTIDAGMLQVSNAGTTGMVSGNIVNNGTLAFNRTDSVTYDATISGSGGVAQMGSGTLILNGVNTYTGGTTVVAGTLEVGDSSHSTASLTSNVTVDSAATLRGHGTIDGNVVSDGLVWPGGSVGVLTVNGNYTQNADATLQIDVTPTQASELLVNGKASLAGGLSLVYAPGTYTGTTYTLVQAHALSGQFTNTVTSGSVPTALNPQLSYTPTQANLVLTSPATTTPTTPTTPTNPTTPTIVAPHDSAIYANFMRSASLMGQQSLATVLGATLRPGESDCAGGTAAHANTLASSCTGGLWVQYSGRSDELNGSNGLNSTSFGLQGGADRSIGDVVHVGVEAGFDRINGNDRNGGNGNIDNVHGGIYAFADAGPLVLSGMIDEAHGSYRVYRATGIAHSSATPDGSTTAAAFQAAWPMAVAQWQVTPVLGALYQHQSMDAFNETVVSANPLASAFAVQGMHSTYTTTQPYVSVSLVRPFEAQGIGYVPQLSIGYRYDTRNGNGPVVNAMAQDGTLFALQGDAMGRGITTVGARIAAQAGRSWSLYLDYQGQFTSHLNDNALSVGFTKHF
jgi:autotransporter-associated beta strand protein